MPSLRLHAPAKVNLGLRIVGKRADGYHLIETTFHAIDLHDTLSLSDASELSLEVVGDGGGLPVPTGDENLVLRAARTFCQHAGVPPAGRFRLEKRIPAGGGLGGGSSDAAAALLLLQHRHGAPLAADALASLAARLGADVPFFLRAGTQHGTGIGEQLAVVPDPPALHLVLIVPPFGTSTAAVFKNHRPDLTHAAAPATVPQGNPRSSKGLRGSTEIPAPLWHNDLEASAEQLYPDLAKLRAAIVGAGFASVSMSGSGSTLFLASGDAARAAAAEERLAGLIGLSARVLRTRSADTTVASRVPHTDVPEPGRAAGGGRE